jgi:hypothetical protein
MKPNLPDDEMPLDGGPSKVPTRSAPPPTNRAKAPTDSEPGVKVPAPPQPEEKLAWGLVGSRNFRGLLSGDSGENGVIRIVEAGVTYTQPPDEACLRGWRRVTDNLQRLEMAWPGDPRSLGSLEVLGQDLGQNAATSPDDPRLSTLDEVVKALLRITRVLHKNSSGLGLLNPRSILIVPGKGGKDVILPDLGFTWKSGPFKPFWLESGDFRALWDSAPEVQQFSGAAFDPVSDIRTLARLFACILTGSPRREVADRPPESSRHQTQNPVALARVWQTLASAVRGDFKTVAQFEERLLESPLSHHVFAMPPIPSAVEKLSPTLPNQEAKSPWTSFQRNRTYVLVLAGALVLLGGIATLLVWKPWASKPNGGSDKSSVFALKEKYLAADAEDQARILWEMYRDGILSTDAQMRQKEQAWRVELRKDFLAKNWIPRFRKAEELSQDLPQRFVSGKKVVSLHLELKMLQERPPTDQAVDAEEKQCFTFSEMRSRELGSAP